MPLDLIPWAWAAMQPLAADMAASAAKQGATRGAEKVAEKAAAAWQKFEWPAAENKYRQRLQEVVRVTRILGNPKQIEIDRIYTDVYLFDKLSAIRRYSESLDEDEVDVHAKLGERGRVDAKEIVTAGGNKFILGRPGAGKTTFLKHLAMLACKGLNARTPIFVSLKDWSDSALPLSVYIEKQFDICGFPSAGFFLEALFRNGRALILLDGLDEVNEWSDKRNQIIRDIVNFSKKYEANQYCLTCRTAATDYSFEQFDYVEVADFTDEQQAQFARQWFGRDSVLFEKFSSAWADPRNSGLRDLGRTPLLLTLLCLSFDESHAFPKRQVDLYQEAIQALLKKWDTSRLIGRDKFYKGLSHGQRHQLLETIAAKFYFNSRLVFRKDEISKVASEFVRSLPDIEDPSSVDGAEVVRQIEAQHGLIAERAHDLYTFSHLTIQEYLTASYISRSQDSKLQRQVVKSALNDQKWREVMLYTVGLLPQADSILDEIQRQLITMKMVPSGALIFLVHCYCSARTDAIAGNVRMNTEEIFLVDLKSRIDAYIGGLRRPSLTPAELAKFFEHVEVLLEFLKPRARKPGYELGFAVVQAAANLFKRDRLDVARLLGGYFIKPEQFINFFYACRLFIECLEVAITSRRHSYLAEIFKFDMSELSKMDAMLK